MNGKGLAGLAIAGAAALGLAWGGWNVGCSYFVPDTVRTRVVGADMQKVDGVYEIATEDGVFQNHDALYRGKWNSKDVQRDAVKADEDNTLVDIKKYGWRFRPLSWCENVLSITPVTEKSEHTR
jgi:hypothetical protein